MDTATEVFCHLSYYLNNWLLRNNSSVRHGAVQVSFICRNFIRSNWRVKNNHGGAHFSFLLDIISTILRMAAACFFFYYSIILTHLHNLKLNWPFKAYWLRDSPTMHQFNNCLLCPHYIYVFCIYLRTDSDLCHFHRKLIGFYNRVEKCLQRGTNWASK
jgi:hypothetical protein